MSSVEYRSSPFSRSYQNPIRWMRSGSTLLSLYIPGSGAPEKNHNMPYKAFEKILDSSLPRIRSSLPTTFTSSDFIKVAKDCFPNEFGTLLRNGSYRSLHSWIARWYLNRRFRQMGDSAIDTMMRNRSKNKVWSNKLQ